MKKKLNLIIALAMMLVTIAYSTNAQILFDGKNNSSEPFATRQKYVTVTKYYYNVSDLESSYDYNDGYFSGTLKPISTEENIDKETKKVISIVRVFGGNVYCYKQCPTDGMYSTDLEK